MELTTDNNNLYKIHLSGVNNWQQQLIQNPFKWSKQLYQINLSGVLNNWLQNIFQNPFKTFSFTVLATSHSKNNVNLFFKTFHNTQINSDTDDCSLLITSMLCISKDWNH